MKTENDLSTIDDQETSMLELFLAVAENLRLLIITPILAGLLGIGFAQLVTPEFESRAVQLGNSTLLAIYNSDQLRDAVIKSVNYAKPDEDPDTSRKRLGKDLVASFNSKDKILTVTGHAQSAQSALKLVQAAVETAAVFNKPQLAQIELLKKQIDLGLSRDQEAAKAAAKVSQQILISPSSNQAALVQSQAQLLEAARAAQATTASLTEQLSKLQTFEIIQSPTLPTRKVWPSKFKFAIAAAAGAFFLILFYVLTKFGFQKAYRSNVSTRDTLDQIHTAWRRSVGIDGKDSRGLVTSQHKQ
jgi:hypothetical protein